MSGLYIGLMSGTSLDGVDGVLLDPAPSSGAAVAVLAHAFQPFDTSLREELLALNSPGANELHRAALAGNSLARVYASVTVTLLGSSNGRPIRAIGAHGQTVRHRPGEFDGTGYTLQLGNPALLAELTGIDVIADFRTRDVAAGGQGAPLAPAFHQALFARPDRAVAVLNLGGMSNLTLLDPRRAPVGFDCGPGNALLDAWCMQHLGQPFDRDGAWAATGQVLPQLLADMLGDPYFQAPPPKSTGRDRFNSEWLALHLGKRATAETPEDVQSTLTELTVRSVASDLNTHGAHTRELLVCGGGAYNQELLRRLSLMLPGVSVRPTDDLGLPATQVEAAAFAWFAHAFIERQPANLPSVTDARGPRLLGALYPA